MNLNAEKETELMEKNSLSSLVSTNSVKVNLKKKIKEEGKGVHSSNINPNRFKSHWRPVSHKKFLPSDKRPPNPNLFKNNHKNRPMKDGKHVQPRFMLPQSAPPNKQWQRKEHRKFSQPLTHTQKRRLQRQRAFEEQKVQPNAKVKYKPKVTKNSLYNKKEFLM